MAKQLGKKVLEHLGKQDWPVTTEMVAKELDVSWNFRLDRGVVGMLEVGSVSGLRSV